MDEAQAAGAGDSSDRPADGRPGRVIVTGGAGFLGSHLCERLVAAGVDVVGLDNFCTGSPANVAHLADRGSFRLVDCDVTEPLPAEATELLDDGHRIDAVLHFASPASPVDYLNLPIETLRVGSVGTFAALELARRARSRFLLASTSEVYGDPLVHPQPEDYWGNVNPVGPRGVYDEAKRFAEATAVAYRDTHGLDCKIVRIFNTFGPRMRPHDGRAIPTFIRQALAGAPITVTGDGKQTRSICFVSDTVEGILRLLGSNEPGPINIGNPHELSMNELADQIRELVGSRSPVVHIERPTDDPSVRRPDITRAQERLGWTPQVPIEAALATTVNWFRGHPDMAAQPLRGHF